MADYEVSKIMWFAIVVALAASIFVIAKPQINTLAHSTFGKISSVTEGIGKSDNTSPSNKINPDDAKWVEKGNYGTNGYFVRDNAGKGIVYALDPQQPVIAPETATFTKGNDNLTSLQFLAKTILPKNSNYYFAFNANLTTFDTKNLDTSNVTDMSNMFDNMYALTALDVSNFNTSHVTNMNGMFNGMSALTALDVSKFDTSNVTDMSGMFNGSSALTSLDVSNFNTSNVTYVAWMFGDRYKDGHKLTRPDTSKMTDVDQILDDMPIKVVQ